MPNKNRIQLLVDALRSGDYEQGQGALERPYTPAQNCCLGVACRVAMKHGLEMSTRQVDGEEPFVTFNGVGGYLPRLVLDWFGLPDTNHHGDAYNVELIDSKGDTVTATALNDDLGADFDAIADAFERTFLIGKDRQDGPPVV